MSLTGRSLVVLSILTLASFAGAAPEVYYPSDVVNQFKGIAQRAEALGWSIGSSPDPSMCYHYQGLVRAHGPGQPYMFLTRSGNQPDVEVPCVQWCSDVDLPCTLVGDGPGNLLVVRMASRNATGERLRSNRIQRDTETADTHPEPEDTVVTVISFNGQNGWPNYGHAGGMQVVGDVLAVALEKPYDDPPWVNLVQFVDISDPENPAPLSSLTVPTSSGFTVGVVAVAPQPNGRYLLLATGEKNELIKIYESNPNDGNKTDLHRMDLTWTHVDNWRPADEPVDPPCVPGLFEWGWPTGGDFDYAHQSLNFVREGGPTGPLFLIGARNTISLPIVGEDRFDLYRVKWDGQDFGLGCAAQRHVQSFPSSDGARIFKHDLGSFSAASGSYVSPGGELIMYTAEHDNDGPGATVKAAEWRYVDMARSASPTFNPTADPGGPYAVPEGATIPLDGSGGQPPTKAWMQMWADPDYTDRYIVIDYDDRDKDDFDNFEDLDDAKLNPLDDGFEFQASALRYFAPLGCTMKASGRTFVIQGGVIVPVPTEMTLAGTGGTVAHDDLHDAANEVDGGNMNDAIDRAEFLSDCDAYYAAPIDVDWDLDRDGSYETSGGSADFAATDLDGPSTASIFMRARHPVDQRSSVALSIISITNVAPAITSVVVTDDLGRPIENGVRSGLAGLPMTVTARFVDDGKPDTHIASIDWDDGSSTPHAGLDGFSPATGGLLGLARGVHSYATPGYYDILATVLDDDGDDDLRGKAITILDPADALQEVADDIAQWIDGLTDRAAIRALTDALRHIVGSQSGNAANGALDKLEADNLNATMVQLREAVEALANAEVATGLSFDEEQGTLALTALAIASAAHEAAVVFAQPPSDAQLRRLEDSAAALDLGRASLVIASYAAAIDAMRDSVSQSTSLLTGA